MSEFIKSFKNFKILKLSYLRNILIVAVIIATLLAVGDILFIYPSFSNLLTKNKEDEATRMAAHLKSYIIPDQTELSSDLLSPELFHEIQDHSKHFKLMRLKIFSKSGETLYSTDPKDIGKINKNRYFFDIVAKGNTYAQVVKKGTKSLEGQKFQVHVVETYIPIMTNDAFRGAFEIYYNITDAKNRLDKLLFTSSAMSFILAISLLIGIIQALIKVGINVTQREEAEEELTKHRDHLEDLVTERTIELSSANKNLKQEIAERELAEEALRQSEEKLAGILNSIPDMIIVVDKELNVTWANHIVVELIGSNPVGKKCFEAFDIGRQQCEACNVQKCFEEDASDEHELQIIRPDGSRMDLWCTASVATRSKDGVPKSVIVVYRDIKEKKLLQTETARASQLASIGELAAGVAHEINNPINGIINCAQMLIDEEAISNDQAEISQRILKAGGRIAMIVRNLLSFARDHKEESELIHIPNILADSLDLTEAQIRNDGIDLILDIPDDIPMIKAHGHQIQQVILNIISNARYALNQKFPGNDKEKIFRIKGTAVDANGRKYVRLVFLDHGNGISADILDRICDPFFSNKPLGVGTGLGLSVSHAIVKDHGGRLYFDSVEGEYAKVIVDLPAAMEKIGE